MKIFFISCFLFLSGNLSVCKSQTCEDMPDQFRSYSEAIETIRNTEFKTTDSLFNGKSSFIILAVFYSCDNENGYLIVTTKRDNEYVHEGVPVNVWKEFKNSNAKGDYYDYNIRKKYTLVLK